MKITMESMISLKPDIKELLEMEWSEYGLDWPFGLNPDWTFYTTLETQGALWCFTMRQDGKLCGYVIFILSNHPHHKHKTCAKMDLFYVLPQFRAGFNSVKLLKYAEERMGADFVMLSCAHGSRVDSLYKRMGYSAVETVYVKVK